MANCIVDICQIDGNGAATQHAVKVAVHPLGKSSEHLHEAETSSIIVGCHEYAICVILSIGEISHNTASSSIKINPFHVYIYKTKSSRMLWCLL